MLKYKDKEGITFSTEQTIITCCRVKFMRKVNPPIMTSRMQYKLIERGATISDIDILGIVKIDTSVTSSILTGILKNKVKINTRSLRNSSDSRNKRPPAHLLVTVLLP